MYDYSTIRALRSGQTVLIEGCVFKATQDSDLKPDDWYIAERSTGPHLLVVREVDREPGHGWVCPTDFNKYPYDIHECVRVEEVDVPPEQATFIPREHRAAARV